MPRAICGFGAFMPGAEFSGDRAFQPAVESRGSDDSVKRAKDVKSVGPEIAGTPRTVIGILLSALGLLVVYVSAK